MASRSVVDFPSFQLFNLWSLKIVHWFTCSLHVFTKHDLQSQKFKDLKGENRELVLAAAHIEDAKTGR